MDKETVLKHISRIIDTRLKEGQKIKSFGGRYDEIVIKFDVPENKYKDLRELLRKVKEDEG